MPSVCGHRHSPSSLANGRLIRFSSDQAHPQGCLQDQVGAGGGATSGSLLASSSLVPRSDREVHPPCLPLREDLLLQDPVCHPQLQMLHLAAWRLSGTDLATLGYSDPVLGTLLAGRRPSTNRVYNYTWQALAVWCASRNTSPESIKVKDFLEFLQSGLKKGLSTSTLKRQTSAVTSILGYPKGTKLASHPH